MSDFFGAADPSAVGAGLVFLVGFVPGLIRGLFDLFGGRSGGSDA